MPTRMTNTEDLAAAVGYGAFIKGHCIKYGTTVAGFEKRILALYEGITELHEECEELKRKNSEQYERIDNCMKLLTVTRADNRRLASLYGEERNKREALEEELKSLTPEE